MTATETPIAEPVDVIEPGTALEVAGQEVVIPPTGMYLPTAREWETIAHIAATLAGSDLVPQAYRKKPQNIALATLAGRPFGWDPTMSMRSFHIIEGIPSMKPEIMLALVRQAGHSVSGESTGSGVTASATVTGRRRDTGDQMTVSWNVDDAVSAGLCEIKNGKIHARSDRNKIKPWEAYPKAMCWARAVSQLCRMLFSDVVLGAGYTPEELGALVDDEGEPIELAEIPPTPRRAAGPALPDGALTVERARWELRDAVGGPEATDDDKAVLRAVWTERYPDGDPPYVTGEDMAAMVADAFARIAARTTPAADTSASDRSRTAELMRALTALDDETHAELLDALAGLGHTNLDGPVEQWTLECVEDAFGWLHQD